MLKSSKTPQQKPTLIPLWVSTSEATARSPPGLHLRSQNSPGPSQPLSASPPPRETAQHPGLAKNKTLGMWKPPGLCFLPAGTEIPQPPRSAWRRGSGRCTAMLSMTLPQRGEGKDAPAAEPQGCTGLTFPFLILPTSFSLSPSTSPAWAKGWLAVSYAPGQDSACSSHQEAAGLSAIRTGMGSEAENQTH